MAEHLKVERRGHVLIATLNREERMNALSQELHDGLPALWDSLKGDRSVRSIVITGAGTRAFCVGMDLQDFEARGGHRPAKLNVFEDLHTTPMRRGLWLPTIVAVNGVCNGSGLHFVTDADVVIASPNASFIDTHVNVGQVAATEPIALVPKIGFGNALRFALLGRAGRISAEEALRISMVHEIVEPERLLDRAIELAEAAAAASPSAVEATKRGIYSTLDRPISEAMQYGWDLLLGFRDHPDNLEGPKAFVEKRDPQWQ
jgi:enoyl-CoA hydratase/carnithine racemase